MEWNSESQLNTHQTWHSNVLLADVQRTIFSLHDGGRYQQNGAIRDPGGGRGLYISACSLSPALRIASLLHCWRNASRTFASITFLFFSCSFCCCFASHKLRFTVGASFLPFASFRATSLHCCLNSMSPQIAC